ncbi:MAG TPA: hypothetical protein VIO14_06150 [Dehalococcoidia bacterium]
MVPRDTRRHLWAALREQLLAVRSAVDAGARWFDERARRAGEGERRREEPPRPEGPPGA